MGTVPRIIHIIILILSLCIPSPSFAQSRPQKLLIGILPEMNVFKQKQRFQLLGEHLSKKTGIRVEFTILSRYGNIIDSFTSEKMDGAFFGSFTGALAIRKLGVVPLARPVNPDGASTYHGYLFVRKDSGITGVREMRGKTMVYVDKTTSAGYLFPLAYLKDNGIKDPEHFFSATFFSGSHDAAVSAVLNRKADVGAAKHSIYDQMKKSDPRIERELMVLAESARMPSNGLCVRKDLDEALKSTLKTILLNLHQEADGKQVLKQFGALKFIETTTADYQPVFDMAAKAGIDVKSYNSRNR